MAKSKDIAKIESAPLAFSGEIADIFKQNASVGTENISSAMPQLKITEGNSHNEGVDGEDVPPGTLYYSPTKEIFKELDISVMTISRGFYALDNQETPKPKFTQLVGGIMLDTMQPFIMFVSGLRLENLWNFGKEINPYTKSKNNPIPMFAFKVKLTLEKKEHKYGKSYIPVFDFTPSPEGIISDVDVLKTLVAGVEKVEEMFDGFIKDKEVDKNTGQPVRYYAKQTADDPIFEEPTKEQMDKGGEEDVNPEDVPF